VFGRATIRLGIGPHSSLSMELSGDIVIETYIETSVAIPTGKVRESGHRAFSCV